MKNLIKVIILSFIANTALAAQLQDVKILEAIVNSDHVKLKLQKKNIPICTKENIHLWLRQEMYMVMKVK